MARSVAEWIGKTDDTPIPKRVKRRKGPLTAEHFKIWSEIDKNTGCWNWLRAKSHGYGVLREGSRNFPAHRRSFELHNSTIVPRNIDVCHKCDNRACVNPDHLFLGTRKINMMDCARKGRINIPNLRGEELTQSKLTEKDVLYIRSSKKSQRALAREFGVDKGTIACIVHRKTWRHV